MDAYNFTVQRELSSSVSAEIAYVGNRGEGFFADNPASDANAPTLVGFPDVPRDQRRPFARFGWTQGIDFYANTGKSRYNALQAKLTKRWSNGFSLLTHYTLQSHKNNSPDYVFIDPDLNYGAANFIRRHVYVLSGSMELPVGKGRRYLTDAGGAADAILGGWQINANATVQSGLPFNVSYRDAGQDRDTGGNDRPNLIGDPAVGSGDGLTTPYFNVTPIGSPGSAFGRPARGTFGDMDRNSIHGPGFWNVDASLFKRFRLGGERHLEFRVEAQNVFNHVNLGNPDSQVGVPGNNNTNAGFITGTAPNSPMRNLQFALRFQF